MHMYQFQDEPDIETDLKRSPPAEGNYRSVRVVLQPDEEVRVVFNRFIRLVMTKLTMR